MAGLGLDIPSVQGRGYCPSFPTCSSHSFLRLGSYSTAERSASINPESTNLYGQGSCSSVSTTSPAGFGCCFGNSHYSFKIQYSTGFQQDIIKQTLNEHLKESLTDTSSVARQMHCNELPVKTKEYGVFQDFTGSSPRIPGYVDVPASGSSGRDINIGCQWNWSSNWSRPMSFIKNQTVNPHVWKSYLAEGTALSQPDVNSVLRRGKKKRVPYTKLQLRELEKEYTTSKFITKDKRQRIAFSTNLSERQVVIWFQNRRVKDKRLLRKST
ncbi:homeobox protein Hox-D13a [Brienomyrus brachyistius]|uniref:homeobox protein Hox-D13a n=1 Tax=Brienomyrus brachyistius TaxID=42636 RepID=UPI0020B2CDEF|nr:homeobox protein Hox-D13a [Brienomyrus brachyistius]